MGQIHSVVPGSAEWHALRAGRYTASEAPVMMGASAKASRNDLLRMKATGDEKEISAWVQRHIFDKGHEYEAAARPIAEKLAGEDLFPATVTDEVDGLPLLASCDGLDMLGEHDFEHKQPNAELHAGIVSINNMVIGGETGTDLPMEYVWQLEQQLLVTGARIALFMVSDGTQENAVWCWYLPVPGRREQLIAGWKQFHADLQAYEPREEKPEPTGKAPEDLPALRIEVRGEVTDSNLEAFREQALAVFQGINTELATDEDFANADKTCKWCSEVEKRLEAAKQHALSQTESIDRLFKTVDEIKEQARHTRLDLDKKVKSRKQSIRDEIQSNTVDALREHYHNINAALPDGVDLGVPAAFGSDVGAAMKGKKNIKSLRDAADDALAKAKIEANEWADRIRANHKRLSELADGYESLFADKQALVLKAPDDLEAVAKARIAEHEAEVERRHQAEKQRAEEAERVRQEAEQQREAEQAPQAAPTPAAPTEDEEAGIEADAAAEQAASGVPGKGAENADAEKAWDVTCHIEVRSTADWSPEKVEREVANALADAGLHGPIQVSVQRRRKEAA